jgi:hypothetical protein
MVLEVRDLIRIVCKVLRKSLMLQKKLMDLWQELRHYMAVRVAVKVVAIIALTAGLLGILGSNAPITHAQVIMPSMVAVNTKIVSTTRNIQTAPNATVYRSPDCSCCHKWIDHLQSQGFQIEDVPTNDIEAIKQKYNVPDNLASCHTAIINEYVVEGHVPAQDIKRLLEEQPKVIGLTVPQMPVGTPGMEIGNQKDPFSVLAFDHKGAVEVFNQYPAS